jgi:hypothetical protein
MTILARSCWDQRMKIQPVHVKCVLEVLHQVELKKFVGQWSLHHEVQKNLETTFKTSCFIVVRIRPTSWYQRISLLKSEISYIYYLDWGKRSALFPPIQWSTVLILGNPCLMNVNPRAVDSSGDFCSHMPNSETKRPARISHLCHDSWDPCQTFPKWRK